MDFTKVETCENGVIIKEVKNFELAHVFDCGQCFRWNRQENGNYIGVAFERVIEVEKREQDIIVYNTNEQDFNEIWCDYFDLMRDYSLIKEELSKDNLLKAAVEFGEGIRLLQQEPFELVISFIISANNRIPMIKRAIEKISSRFGKTLEYKGKIYYAFPSLDNFKACTIEDLEECGTGFRAKYIKDTIENLKNGNYDLEDIKSKNDDNCFAELQKFMGIGPKVADCIMLFSMQKYSAFPVDVWVKRAMQHFYLAPDVSLKKIREFARNKFGILSGFSQQYLFYYARENNIKI
ncbi:MAG: DNA glycosylase [Bacillota bacterium]|nr:DNA glycosylase [Bacillota bacterium]